MKAVKAVVNACLWPFLWAWLFFGGAYEIMRAGQWTNKWIWQWFK